MSLDALGLGADIDRRETDVTHSQVTSGQCARAHGQTPGLATLRVRTPWELTIRSDLHRALHWCRPRGVEARYRFPEFLQPRD